MKMEFYHAFLENLNTKLGVDSRTKPKFVTALFSSLGSVV